MKQIFLLISLAIASCGVAKEQGSVVGSYQLDLPIVVRDVATRLDMPTPYGRILLRNDGTFSYALNTGGAIESASGIFRIQDRHISLTSGGALVGGEAKVLLGEINGDELQIGDFRYVKIRNAPSIRSP